MTEFRKRSQRLAVEKCYYIVISLLNFRLWDLFQSSVFRNHLYLN